MKHAKIPANVGHSMSPQGKQKKNVRAKQIAEKLASGNYKLVDGHLVKLED